MARLNKDWTVEIPEGGEGNALAAELHAVLEVSHRQAKGLIDAGCVKVNGQVVTAHGQRLKAGDEVHVNYDPHRTYQALPGARKIDADPYEVLWEDKHLLFVNKPAGLLTVPSETGKEPTLADAITDHYRRRGFKRFKLFIVHRLDRHTSGVLVFAKTPEALGGLKDLFEEHKLNRVYRAVLVGELPENRGTLAGHLVETKALKMRVVEGNKKGAKTAVTHYRVLERLPGHTVVEITLETGRRNQIRVQFADKGYPLLGDHVYGEASELIDRQALHAELLGFKHPVEGDMVTVTAPLPADLESALKALRTRQRLVRAEAGQKGEEGLFKPKISREKKIAKVQRARRFEEMEKERQARPARPRREEGEAPRAPRRKEGEAPRGPRRTDGESMRAPRRQDGDARPRRPRAEGEETRSPRPRRTEGAAPARAPRPRREEGEAPSPRRFDGPARPRRDEGERPRRPRTKGAEDRPRRTASGPARPRREEGEAPRRPSARPAARPAARPDRPASDRPRRPQGDAPRPARPGARPSGAAARTKAGAPAKKHRKG